MNGSLVVEEHKQAAGHRLAVVRLAQHQSIAARTEQLRDVFRLRALRVGKGAAMVGFGRSITPGTAITNMFCAPPVTCFSSGT